MTDSTYKIELLYSRNRRNATYKWYSTKNNVPVILISFDTNTSKVGVETRIEAFVDMLKMKKGRL